MPPPGFVTYTLRPSGLTAIRNGSLPAGTANGESGESPPPNASYWDTLLRQRCPHTQTARPETLPLSRPTVATTSAVVRISFSFMTAPLGPGSPVMQGLPLPKRPRSLSPLLGELSLSMQSGGRSGWQRGAFPDTRRVAAKTNRAPATPEMPGSTGLASVPLRGLFIVALRAGRPRPKGRASRAGAC